MSRRARKLTAEQIADVEADSRSYADFVRIARKRYGVFVSHDLLVHLNETGQISKEEFAKRRREQEDIRMFSEGHMFTSAMRNRIIEIRGHQCEVCGTGETWNGKPLSLQVHHIDGNRRNNRQDNLMVLCPNCHALTDNYGAKNVLSSVDESLIRDLYETTGSLEATVRAAGLSLTDNTMRLIRAALSTDE